MNNPLMGSLAGPESPNPCSQRMKLLAMASEFFGGDEFVGSMSRTKKMVKPKVIRRTRKGFSNGTNFIFGLPKAYSAFFIVIF